MRKKITLLICCMAIGMLCNMTAWGQQYSWTSGTPHTDNTAFDNNYGPGETGTITNDALSAPTSWGTQGRLTIGNTSNVMRHWWHTTSWVRYTGSYSTCGYTQLIERWSNYFTVGGSSPTYPISHDGTAYSVSASPTYTTTTVITIDGSTTRPNQNNPLAYEHLLFLDNPWYYRNITLTATSGSGGSCSSGLNTYTWGTQSWTLTSSGLQHVGTSAGYVNGQFIITAGSHVQLGTVNETTHQASNGTISSSMTASLNSSTLTLPGSGTRYSLMVAGFFNAASITTKTNLTTLAPDATLGIYTGINEAVATNPAGGTILIGPNTSGQQHITIHPATTPNASGFRTAATTNTYLGYRTPNAGTVNLGNYAGDGMTVTNAGTMFSNVGTSDMHIYNHACSKLEFITSSLSLTIGGTGNLFIDSYDTIYFNTGSNPSFTNSVAQKLSVSGGVVRFNAPLSYTGSNTGNMYMHAYTTSSSITDTYLIARSTAARAMTFISGATAAYCGVGDLVTTVNATVTVGNSGGNASSLYSWHADRDIKTGSTVTFTNSNNGSTQWFAGRDIITNTDCNPATGNGAVLFNTTAAAGNVLWEAIRNIHTKGKVDFNYASGATGNLSLISVNGDIINERAVNIEVNDPLNTVLFSAEDPTLTNGNIHIYDSINIQRKHGTGTGYTNIFAQRDITTAMVTFESQSTTGDETNIISHLGDIWLGHNSNNNPSILCLNPVASPTSYNLNYFKYTIPVATAGKLTVQAGYNDLNASSVPDGGGNIYFTRIEEKLSAGSLYDTEFSIPFSNRYYCSNASHNSRSDYEMSGIIGGVHRCAVLPSLLLSQCDTVGLNYEGYDGELLFDAGTRGNIIINNGARLDFQQGNGHAKFLTQGGDIDMRYPFEAVNMQGNLLFYANSLLPNKHDVACGCDEERNNIYMQDFWYTPSAANGGSVFFGADNNIKLQYGGLKNIDHWKDPFWSGDAGYPCGTKFHCDADTSENQAQPLILDYSNNTSGGVGIVASDMIDIYKQMIYTGGANNLLGMSAVPYGDGRLHGEMVAGYGLYIKTQGNKKNWNINPFDILDQCEPKCPPDECGNTYLHSVVRLTFHDDARIRPENSRAYIGSPVFETFGNLELNTHQNSTNRTSLRVQTDSLIVHDSLIIEGTKLQLDTWSSLPRNMPVVKLGHHRFTPPVAEDAGYCADCYRHVPVTGERALHTALDTVVVTFREGASIERLHTLVADHAVLTFLTDSFDNNPGNPTIDATFYTDIFKVRNQVEMWGNSSRTHSGHFELISELQMNSKNYPGVFARHLHMEPIAPDCKKSNRTSDLWLTDRALDVISSTTFGGFGTLHADVHVETQAKIAPGYASLGVRGNCYEQVSGTLKMNDLRLDKGAELHFSIGNQKGFDDWETDILEVDSLSLDGNVFINIEVRCNQKYNPGCYPIILYKSVGEENLNNLHLATLKLGEYQLSLDFEMDPGVIYLCVGEPAIPSIQRQIFMPNPPAGVSIYPVPGVHYIPWGNTFNFTLAFTDYIYEVWTNRLMEDGTNEILDGILNANGEYEYSIPFIKTQPLYIYIGPNIVSNEFFDKDALVWSYGHTLYFNVPQEDIASIYSITGMLVKRVEVPEGGTSVPMQRGVFIVTLKDGSVHKVIIR